MLWTSGSNGREPVEPQQCLKTRVLSDLDPTSHLGNTAKKLQVVQPGDPNNPQISFDPCIEWETLRLIQ